MARKVNEKLVMKLEASLGFSTESVQRAVENNKHNHLSATYYLLLKKYSQASYKSEQAQRNSSVTARVDTSYHNSSIQSNTQQTQKRQSNKASNQHSDSKSNRPSAVVTTSEHQTNNSVKPGAATSAATTPNSAKYGKGLRTKAIEEDRFKAPVQD